MNITKLTHTTCILLIGWLLVSAALNILPSTTAAFWARLPGKEPSPLTQTAAPLVQTAILLVVKIGIIIALIAFPILAPRLTPLTRRIGQHFQQQAREFQSLPILVRTTAFAWICLMCYFLATIPYQYDEAWSYHYFSRQGWLRTATYYPLPNNHILFNLIASVFVKWQLPPVTATRLPNLLAVGLAVWWFPKLSRRHFSKALTLFLTLLFATSFPLIMYGMLGRGYGLLIACAILQLDAADRLSASYTNPQQIGHNPDNGCNSRYRWLYYTTLIAGLYTVPSYLYFVFPVHLLLFISVLRQKTAKPFFRDSILAALPIAIVYGIVIGFNGIKVLASPNESTPLQYAQLMPALWDHLRLSWQWLSETHLPLACALILFAAPLLDALVRRKRLSWLGACTAILIISPLVILLLHRVIPFERTWTYMVVPLILAIGFLLSPLRSIVHQRIIPASLLLPVIPALLIINFARYKSDYYDNHRTDYFVTDLFNQLRPEIESAQKIYITQKNMEWYFAEQLIYWRSRSNPYRSLTMGHTDSIQDQDILILDPSLENTTPGLENYKKITRYAGLFSLYIKQPETSRR